MRNFCIVVAVNSMTNLSTEYYYTESTTLTNHVLEFKCKLRNEDIVIDLDGDISVTTSLTEYPSNEESTDL